MVLAVIYFDAKDAKGFEAALIQNAGSVIAADGYVSHQLRRGVEEPQRYLLSVKWESIEHHAAWQKAHGEEFLGAIGPYLDGGPDIKHFVEVGA